MEVAGVVGVEVNVPLCLVRPMAITTVQMGVRLVALMVRIIVRAVIVAVTPLATGRTGAMLAFAVKNVID